MKQTKITNEINNALKNQLGTKITAAALEKIILYGALAITLFLLYFLLPIHHVLTTLLLLAGLAFLALSLIQLSKSKKNYIYLPTGSRVKCYKTYLRSGSAQTIAHAIERGDIPALTGLASNEQAGTCLYLLLSDDGALACMQLYTFSLSYVYEPYSELTHIDAETAKKLITAL